MIRKYAESFCWKNVSSFCSAKATHIFSAKNIRILCIESARTVNEMTLNELIKLTTLWTTGPCLLFDDLSLPYFELTILLTLSMLWSGLWSLQMIWGLWHLSLGCSHRNTRKAWGRWHWAGCLLSRFQDHDRFFWLTRQWCRRCGLRCSTSPRMLK